MPLQTPKATRNNLKIIDRISKRYGTLPSDVAGLERGTIGAFQLNLACFNVGVEADNLEYEEAKARSKK